MAEEAENSDVRVVLIAGSCSDRGRTIALEFAKLGHKVAITGHEQSQLDLVLNELCEASPVARGFALDQLLAIKVNFEHEEEVDPVVPRVVAKFGRLDVLINNADWLGPSRDPADETFFDDFQKVLRVNLMSAVRLAQQAAPQLIRRQAGDEQAVLINVSSAGKQVSNRVAQAGLSMLTKTLANSFEGKKVRVLCIAPGPISATRLARIVVFLASNQNSYMHGSTMDLDGSHLAA